MSERLPDEGPENLYSDLERDLPSDKEAKGQGFASQRRLRKISHRLRDVVQDAQSRAEECEFALGHTPSPPRSQALDSGGVASLGRLDVHVLCPVVQVLLLGALEHPSLVSPYLERTDEQENSHGRVHKPSHVDSVRHQPVTLANKLPSLVPFVHSLHALLTDLPNPLCTPTNDGLARGKRVEVEREGDVAPKGGERGDLVEREWGGKGEELVIWQGVKVVIEEDREKE